MLKTNAKLAFLTYDKAEIYHFNIILLLATHNNPPDMAQLS